MIFENELVEYIMYFYSTLSNQVTNEKTVGRCNAAIMQTVLEF